MENDVGLNSVREQVKKFAEDGRAKNALIATSAGPSRQTARCGKRTIGGTARVLLLAYAMMRGVPYDRLERKTRTSSWRLGLILEEVSEIVSEHRPGVGQEEVMKWFRGQQVSS